MWLAKETVLLGHADRLEITGDDGASAAILFPEGSHALLSNADGNALYIVPLDRSAPSEVPKGRKGQIRLFKSWAKRPVDSAIRIKVPKGSEELHKIGYAARLFYTSDKWVDTPRKYVHDFTAAPTTYADRQKNPRTFGILATHGARLVTARGIVG